MLRKILTFLFTITLSMNLSAADVDRREVGNLVIENIPEIPQVVKERLNQYNNTRSAYFTGWTADGDGVLIITRFGETSQVHFVDRPGGARQQLTFFDEPVGGVDVKPSGGNPGFLFTKDQGGNEVAQIFWYDAINGSYKMLSDGISRHGSINWNTAGDRFAYQSNKRNGSDFDIYVAEISNPSNAKLVYEGKGHWGVVGWSPDSRKLLIYNYISINDATIYTLDLATAALKPLDNSSEPVAMGDAKWARDGKGIYFTSDKNTEFKKLRYLDISTGKTSLITDNINWDIEGITLSKDGKWAAFTANENGRSQLYLMKTSDNKHFKPIEPEGTISGMGFSPDSKKLALTINSYNTPSDVFVMDIENYKLERWTYSEVGGLNTSNFIEPELIEYPTFDKVDGKQRMIPAFYYKPKGPGPFPVVLYFHGGPEAQFRPGFISTFQYWLNELGVAIIAPNVRGSDGYGKNYLQLDNGFLRENSVKDGGALIDWVKKQADLDPNKIAVFGGSYGGYMSLAMMTNYNDQIAAGVDVVGISNFVTFLKNTGDYRRDLRRAEYGDEQDPRMNEFLQNISPTNNAHKITKPLFVVQGLNDPRVPASEAEQMVEIVRKNEGQVWYLLAKDEGHGFSKKSNRDYYNEAVALFWQYFLK